MSENLLSPLSFIAADSAGDGRRRDIADHAHVIVSHSCNGSLEKVSWKNAAAVCIVRWVRDRVKEIIVDYSFQVIISPSSSV